ASDYKKYISTVDVIEVTLTKRNRDAVVKVINQYDANYSSVFSDGIMESGLKSIRDTVIVSAVLMLVSFYSALAFVEMFVHFQKKILQFFIDVVQNKRIFKECILEKSHWQVLLVF
ncbi:MAG: hypothetical protein U0L23_09790, partial [Lachnospiraceae bacterium]|nr:hypothetical protein [Lachnospiraceae bacterium]